MSKVAVDNGHWIFPQQLDCSKAWGFVYMIVDTERRMMYIGKKQFRHNSQAKKGSQTKWKQYTSSSNLVNEQIATRGLGAFKFYVLEQYTTPGGLGWAETWTQCRVEVPTNHQKFYNRNIEKVTWRSKELVTSRHKARLEALVSIWGK